MIPPFGPDGYLPVGIHVCTVAEATFRFGGGSQRRKRLIVRVRRWVELSASIGVRRLMLDGSFVTDKRNPEDVDAVALLPSGFDEQVARGDVAASELQDMLLTRQPAELFAAEDEADWDDWVEFFTRTREADRRRKGVVEIKL